MTHPILRPLAALMFAGLVFLALHAVVRGELPTVTAVLETRPSFGDDAGGNADADDPAIWVDPKDPTRSFVVATLKEGGLDVYDLSGSLVQHIAPEAAPPGMALNSARYNNVDLIYGFKLKNQKVDLAVASDRYNDMIRVFAIDPTALATGGDPLTEITAPGQPWIFVDTEEELEEANTAYGLAVTQTDPDGKHAFAFVSRSAFTSVAKLRLFATTGGRVGYEVLETFDLPEVFNLPSGGTWNACHDDDGELSQVEGMVVDDYSGILYLGQEQVGWWATSVSKPSTNLELVDRCASSGCRTAGCSTRRRKNSPASSTSAGTQGWARRISPRTSRGSPSTSRGRAPDISSCRARGSTSSSSTTGRRSSTSATLRSGTGWSIRGRSPTACTW